MQDPARLFRRFVVLSRCLFIASAACFLTAFLLSVVIGGPAGAIGPAFGLLGAVSFLVSWVMPGVLFVLGLPSLARAWLRGLDPLSGADHNTWQGLSAAQRVTVYFVAALLSGLMLLIVVSLVIRYLRAWLAF